MKEVPDYIQVMRVTTSDGTIKELLFPKGLDLNRPKRPRTTFSPEQLHILEKEFFKNPYLIGKEREKLAKQLGLSETQVKVWFQNRRTKYKKVTGTEPENLSRKSFEQLNQRNSCVAESNARNNIFQTKPKYETNTFLLHPYVPYFLDPAKNCY